MKWNDYVYLGLCVTIVILLIVQIINIHLTRKQSKLQLSNAKFKLGQIVYTYSGKKLIKHTVNGIVVRKNELAYELDNCVIYNENKIYATYEELKKLAVANFAKELDDDYARL